MLFRSLVLRGAVREPGQRARFCAVVGILGAALVPFIHVTVYLFRTQHPLPVVLNPQGPQLPGTMLATLLFALAVFTLFYSSLVWQRYAQADLAEARAARQADQEDARA